MKRLIISLAALVLAVFTPVLLVGCSESDNAELGVYTCALIRADGDSFASDSVHSSPAALELKSGARAELIIDAQTYSGRWSTGADGEFELKLPSGTSKGTLSNGVCTLDLLGEGVEYVFIREGATLPDDAQENSAAPQNALQRAWNGDWYGAWTISAATGEWETLDRQSYDLFACISVDENGLGTMTLWDEKLTASTPMAEITVEVTLADDGAPGTLRAVEGNFWLAPVERDVWSFSLSESEFADLLYLPHAQYTSGEGSFNYSVILRPWGADWSDIEQIMPELLPYYYHDWYLPVTEAGERMPDSFDISMIPEKPEEDAQEKEKE